MEICSPNSKCKSVLKKINDMSLFKSRRKCIQITQEEPTYKVQYLGNVHSSMLKGDGCVDKATRILWNNFQTSNQATEMRLTVCAFGIRVKTKEQGVTEYRSHRITYCIAPPEYPKLFVWVYRHEGKKFKIDPRCHAVLCQSTAKAKAMALHLNEKISIALKDFLREKNQQHRNRVLQEKTKGIKLDDTKDKSGGIPMRTKMLSRGANFKLPIINTPKAPKLAAITESISEPRFENGTIEEEDEEEYEDNHNEEEYDRQLNGASGCACAEEDDAQDEELLDESIDFLPTGDKPDEESDSLKNVSLITENLAEFQLGNDEAELRKDKKVQAAMLNPDCEDDISEKSPDSSQNSDILISNF